MDQTNSYCIFSIDDQLYGIAVSGVEKIIRAAAIIALPDVPETIIGLLNVEGSVLPVVNIRKKWRLPEREMSVDDRIILFKAGTLVSFIVNSVVGVIQFDHSVMTATTVGIFSSFRQNQLANLQRKFL